MTKNDVNINSVVDVRLSYPNSIFSGHTTYSTLFLTPVFDVYQVLIDNVSGRLVNCYIDDMYLPHDYKRPMFMLIRSKLDGTYDKIHSILSKNSNFVYSYVAGKNDEQLLLMYVFTCPKAYEKDYDKIMAGEYSKTSDKYKGMFNKSVPTSDGTYKESAVYGILYKTNTLKKKVETFLDEKLSKEQEYFGTFVPDYEIFRYLN